MIWPGSLGTGRAPAVTKLLESANHLKSAHGPSHVRPPFGPEGYKDVKDDIERRHVTQSDLGVPSASDNSFDASHRTIDHVLHASLEYLIESTAGEKIWEERSDVREDAPHLILTQSGRSTPTRVVLLLTALRRQSTINQEHQLLPRFPDCRQRSSWHQQDRRN